MTKFNQLNKEQRDIIQYMICKGDSFTTIGNAIGKDRTTISKEIRRNRYIKSFHYEPFDNNAIEKAVSKCKKLSTIPYICNTCPKLKNCTNHKIYYNSKVAQKHYEELLTQAREGIDIKPETIDEIEKTIVPLIKDKRQSINQVYINHFDILSMSKPTFYKYVNDEVFSLKNIDLPKKVKYKPRKKKKNTHYKRDITILQNRKYEDYLDFISKHIKMNKVQLDTVIGRKTDSKVLLTMYIVDTHFMLIFLLDKKTSENVSNVFRYLKEKLSISLYRKVFRIILTDNGIEFYNPYEMEYDYNSSLKICNVFYCKPYSSWQKHEIEVNHEYIRRVLPKGNSFKNLTDDIIKKLQDNINAIPRDSLNGKTPYDLTLEKYPDFIKVLNCSYIKPDDVDLSRKNILGDSNE